jgi:spore germination protein YaaH
MYAGAASRDQLWEVEPIGQEVDYIIVMAYDFHRRSSPLAGPVAPIFGGKELWDSDISEHLRAFLEVVPSQKILLGVPFYGYEWQTVSGEPQSATFPDTGSTASFERVQTLLGRSGELHLKEGWNEDALSPYLSYQEDGETFVVYYENSRSLSYKIDFVNQLDLGGIAIWALGYEGSSRELWDVIEMKL